MKDLVTDFGSRLIPFKQGDIIEVKVLEAKKNRIAVDVAGFCNGIIPEREFSLDAGDIKPGDKTLAYVLNMENDDGNCILSLRRADKEKVSKILEEKFNTGGILTVKCTDANRGGLLCVFGDYEGFLPVSQLASSHYPKVSSGDKEEILGKLRRFINQNFQVKILTFEPQANKLIFSEKAAGDIVQQEKIKNFKVGQILEGEVTGVVDFGLFVNIGEVEGLVHISEVSWDHVDNLKELYKPGDKIKAQITSVENGRISLSVKRLTDDPWVKLVEKYKKDDIVSGEVTKITPFGAFVNLNGIDGLVHRTEMGDEVSDPSLVVELGKEYNFRIVSIEKDLHKLSLSLKDIKPRKAESKKTTKNTKKQK